LLSIELGITYTLELSHERIVGLDPVAEIKGESRKIFRACSLFLVVLLLPRKREATDYPLIST
jgi:hypothetical protein